MRKAATFAYCHLGMYTSVWFALAVLSCCFPPTQPIWYALDTGQSNTMSKRNIQLLPNYYKYYLKHCHQFL